MRLSLAIGMLAAVPMFAADGSMTDAERAFLVDQFVQSKKNFLASIKGVDEAQWKFKPAPNVWSIAECAEHIVLSEDYIFGAAMQILKTPAVDRLPGATAEGDKKLVMGVEDRSHKATAPEPIAPSGGKFATPADAAAAFTASRDKHIAYVKATQDPLRVHAMQGPAGMMDAYQFLILVASHTTRHTAQLNEVKNNADFPKGR
jgi:hypothetical protein